MKSEDEMEIGRLRARQVELEFLVAKLGRELEAVAQRLENRKSSLSSSTTPVERPMFLPATSLLPPIIPPIIPVEPAVTAPADSALAAGLLARRGIERTAPPMSSLEISPVPAVIAPDVLVSPKVSPSLVEAEDASLEMRLGTYWAVRVGVVILLTGLVFLGNYAYQNYIGKFGPAGKIALLYLISFGLLGAGRWLLRPAGRESLKNFAQVIFGGGLAAVYFTTYAAHHFENVRVIENPVLDGILLLGWTGYMVWLADRRKSEVLAFFALGLAYYTSLITQVGDFTLYSNLLLAGAAVFFLWRNRWAALSTTALVATYASFVWWRLHQVDSLNYQFVGNAFLAAYWLIFTASVFLSRTVGPAAASRVQVAGLNNLAFFLLVVWSMWGHGFTGFWKFALGFGVVLLGLAQAFRRYLPDEPAVARVSVAQGILLVTVGLIAKFSGQSLALILAVECVALLMVGRMVQSKLLEIFAHLLAPVVLVAAGSAIHGQDARGLLLGATITGLMIFNAWRVRPTVAAGEPSVQMHPGAALFSLIAILVAGWTTFENAPEPGRAAAFAIEGLIFTVSCRVLRLREFAVLAQGPLMVGGFLGLIAAAGTTTPWWNPVLVIASVLGASHWWQRQTSLTIDEAGRRLLEGLYAIGFVAVLGLWTERQMAPEHWMAAAGAMAIGVTIYGLITRAWLVAVAGQLLLAAAALEFLRLVPGADPDWPWTMAPLACTLVLSLGTTGWLQVRPDSAGVSRGALLNTAFAYRITAFIMALIWTYNYIPGMDQIWFLSAVGAALFGVAGWRRSRETLAYSALFYACGFAVFFVALVRFDQVIYWPNFLAVFALGVMQQIARRFSDRYPLEESMHGVMMVSTVAVVWSLIARWVVLKSDGGHFLLTVSWTGVAVAVLALGLGLRERIYRWLGLGILACALGRILLIDIWKLELIYRIISFMALGGVLLAVGFVYNRFQETLRRWL